MKLPKWMDEGDPVKVVLFAILCLTIGFIIGGAIALTCYFIF